MAAIDQATAVLEGLAGKTLTNTQMVNVVEEYINYRDSAPLTNEEKAALFIEQLLKLVKRKVKAGAGQRAVEDNAAAVQASVDASIADL